MKNDVWDVVPRPEGKSIEGKSIVSSKWIYKIKHVADGSIEKHKARFMACGFSPKEGVEAWKFVGNNSKGFSPVNVPNYPMTV